jgi:hypothetical protein
MTQSLFPMMAGMLALAFGAIALFFARFRRTTGDRLFAWFALAFTLLAVERVAGGTAVALGWTESTLWVYIVRLIAFLVILLAVVDKNVRSPEQPDAN